MPRPKALGFGVVSIVLSQPPRDDNYFKSCDHGRNYRKSARESEGTMLVTLGSGIIGPECHAFLGVPITVHSSLDLYHSGLKQPSIYFIYSSIARSGKMN